MQSKNCFLDKSCCKRRLLRDHPDLKHCPHRRACFTVQATAGTTFLNKGLTRPCSALLLKAAGQRRPSHHADLSRRGHRAIKKSWSQSTRTAHCWTAPESMNRSQSTLVPITAARALPGTRITAARIPIAAASLLKNPRFQIQMKTSPTLTQFVIPSQQVQDKSIHYQTERSKWGEARPLNQGGTV